PPPRANPAAPWRVRRPHPGLSVDPAAPERENLAPTRTYGRRPPPTLPGQRSGSIAPQPMIPGFPGDPAACGLPVAAPPCGSAPARGAVPGGYRWRERACDRAAGPGAPPAQVLKRCPGRWNGPGGGPRVPAGLTG